MAKNSLYPESPADVPADLTSTSSQYKMQTLLVLFACSDYLSCFISA